MAKVYLDTNKVIDIAFRKPEIKEMLSGHEVYISPLSLHILCYVEKIKIPNDKITQFENGFFIVDLTNKILKASLSSPTPDLEDNIQLHSAAEAECHYFLTRDKSLLKLAFFGKTRIVETLPSRGTI